jgi:hypothetical protein
MRMDEWEAQNSGGSGVSLQYQSLIYPVFNVVGYGAKGDGVTPDTESFQAAADDAALVAGAVYVPPSVAGYVIDDRLTLNGNTSLIGSLAFPNMNTAAPLTSYLPWGSTLLFTTPSSQIVMNKGGNTIHGLTFYWPNQTDTNPPIIYPAAIALGPGNYYDNHVSNIYVVNAYNFLNAAVLHGRLWVQNVIGWCLNNGIYIDGSDDSDHVENVHWNPGMWPIGGGTEASANYAKANMVGLTVGRADGIVVNNYFCFGAFRGVQTVTSTVTTGTVSGFMNNISIDDWNDGVTAAIGILLQDYNQLEINNLSVCGVLVGLYISANEPGFTLLVNNFATYGALANAVVHTGNGIVIINGADISMVPPATYGAIVFIGPSVAGYTAEVHINDGSFFGGGVNYATLNDARFYVPTAIAVVGILSLKDCHYVQAGQVPTVYKDTGNGTFKLRTVGAPAAGYLTSQPSVPPSGSAYTNTTGVTLRMFIAASASTVAISINTTSTGVTIPINGFFPVDLGPNETIGLTYANAPTWKVFGL